MSGGLMIPFLIVVAVAVVVAAIVASRRSRDGVDSFRRQIDALSPEARRPVIDQVQNAAGRQPERDEDADDPDRSDDEDGLRGA